MMLRASSKQEGVDVDLESVVDSDADSGLPNGKTMNAFVEAILGGDEAVITTARETLRTEMGDAALVDCAAVLAGFMHMDRLADGTGIVQPRIEAEPIREMVNTLGIDKFASAQNTLGVSSEA